MALSKFYIRPFPYEYWDKKNYRLSDDNRNFLIRVLHSKSEKKFLQYTPDGILYNMSQEQVFQNAIHHHLEFCLRMKNVDMVILSIGQSCCGKTYSMLALEESPISQGIVPRLLSTLMQLKESTKDMKMNIQLSYIENSKDAFYDLLSSKTTLKVVTREGEITKINTSDMRDGLQCFYQGEKRRKKNTKVAHKGSNLSNTIITFHITETYSKSSRVCKYKIHCMDTVGFDQRDNIALINNYATFISDFKSKRTIETTQSFLCKYFGKQINELHLITLAHISMQEAHLKKTLSLLRLASPTRAIIVRFETPLEYVLKNISRSKNIIENLHRESTMHDLIYDERFVPDFKSQTDYDNIRKHAAEYFNNEISVIDYTDIESIHLIIRYFKSIYLDLVLNKEKYLNDEKLEILEKLKNELIDHNILNEEQAIAEARDRIKGKKKRKGGKGLPLTVDNKGKKQKNIPRDEIRSAKEPISIQPTEDTKDIKSQENKVDRYFEDFLKNELFQNKYREIEDLEPTLTDVKMKLYTIVGEYYRSLVHYEPKQLECILYTGGKNMGECVKLGTKLDELILEKNQQNHFLQEIQQLKTDLLLKQTLINRLYSELENEFIKYCSFDGSAGSDLGDLTNEFKENSLYGPQTEI